MKDITISINHISYEVIEKLAFISDLSVQDYIKNALDFAIKSELENNADIIGGKICKRLSRLLEELKA